MKRLAQILIKLYQVTTSAIIPHYCRFQPTCSYYAMEAITQYGFIKGSWLALKRLVHCHPFSKGGYDPVP